ncbi:MAG: T9SS type A sorting domain-containing protein [Bacteroidales bacterium]|nr:T9SS type A sorting domain-containing protein [Bacteroidales bacterium]
MKDVLIIDNKQLTIHTVEILDVSGKKLSTFNSPFVTKSINISALPQGLYFIQIKTDKGIVTERFMKE